MAGIYFDARIDGNKLQSDIASINQKLNGLSQNVQKTGGDMDNVFKKLSVAMAGYFSLNFGAQFVTSIARVRGEFQQLEVAFETMLGSKGKADALMAQVVEFAAKTPFELKDVASGAKMLLAFGTVSEEIMPTLKSLGDVAAGLSVPIERLILNFGQIKTQGRLTGRELRDFSVAGVPLIATLSQTLNKSEQAIQEMVSAGKIGFKEVQDAFTAMSSEGGRFANLMDKQSKTITGMQSNLRDAWDRMLNDIGKNTEGIIAGSIRAAMNLVENYEEVIKVLKVLVVTYGAYKAAVVLVAVAQKTMAMAGAIKQFLLLRRSISLATAAQRSFNAATIANPYALAIAGIAMVVTVLSTFIKKKNEAANSVRQFEAAMEDEKKTLTSLFATLKNTTAGTTERKKAIVNVNELYGGYLANLLSEKSTLEEITIAQKDATAALQEDMQVKMQNAKIEPFKANWTSALDTYKTKLDSLTEDLTNTQRGTINRLMGDFVNNMDESIKKTGVLPSKYFYASINQIFKNVTGKGLDEKKFFDLAFSISNVASAQQKLAYETKNAAEEWGAYGGILDRGPVDNEKVAEELKQYESLFVEATKLTVTEAEKLKSALDSIVTTGLSKGSQEKVAAQIKSVTDYLARPEAAALTAKMKTDMDAANAMFEDMQSGKIKATIDEYDAQKELSKNLTKAYEERTGQTVKDLTAQKKADKERLDSKEDIAARELDLLRKTQAAKIAIMQEGAAKERAEAEYEYQQQLDQINKSATEYKEALSTDKNLSGAEIQTKITAVDTQSDEQKTAAKKEYANKLVKINQEAAARVKEIWDSVTDVFLSDQERETAAVTAKYAKQAKDMQASAVDINQMGVMLAANEASRKREQATVDQKYALAKIGLEEDIAMRQNEIAAENVGNDKKMQAAQLKTFIYYSQKRIDLLSKISSEANKIEINGIITAMNTARDEVLKIGNVAVNDVIQSFESIIYAAGDIDDELKKVLDTMMSVANQAINVMSAFKSPDKFAAFSGVMGIISSTFLQIITSSDSIDKTIERINKRIETQNKLLASTTGENYYQALQKQLATYDDLIKKSTTNAKILFLQLDYISKYGKAPEGFQNWDLETLFDKWSKGLINLTNDQIEAVTEGYEAIKEKANLLDETWNKITDTSRDSIAGGIIDGFNEGFDSAADFADSFEEMMKTAILNSIKTKIIEGPLLSWYEGFAEAGKGGFTAEEIAALKLSWSELVNTSKGIYESIEAISGQNLEAANKVEDGSLTGAVRGITEETAGLIAGQFMAMRENLWGTMNNTATIRDISRQIENNGQLQLNAVNESVTHLSNIEKNTRDISRLAAIQTELETMNRNIKNL